MNQFNEDTLVQATVAEQLYHELGWDESIHAQQETLGKEGTLGRSSQEDVILERYLGEKLMQLNPDLPIEAYQDAIQQLKTVEEGVGLLAANKEKHQLYLEGVKVTFTNAQGEAQTEWLRLIDFDQPENNHFLVVREFWIKHQGSLYRADIMGFVNGIPLLFVELKALHKGLREAYDNNLTDYKHGAPNLLHHNALLVLSNGEKAKLGSISSQYEHFHEWKRLAEDDQGCNDAQTLFRGIASKANLLDLVENFIFFDQSSGKTIKIIARNHQFLGVNQAVKSVQERKQRNGKLGVFWHTQGSGKSYSMAFFTRKVHRKLGGNFTFLVLTDRDDLDSQLYRTFAGCGLADSDPDKCRASDGKHLEQLLKTNNDYIFSLIQKFNQSPKQAYTERDDIIVISDEAHRTQYGLLAQNMRQAVPNASYIGFTGTPLFDEDEITQRQFGDYISTYDFQRAVDDGATVPLYYDARGEKLVFKEGDGKNHSVADPVGLNKKIAEKLAEFELEDDDTQTRLEKALKRDYHILTSEKRLDQIAKDFVSHYSNAWESGKAMFVCLDKVTCARMYDLIDQHWQAEIKRLEKQVKFHKIKDEQEQAQQQQKINWMKETQMAVVVSKEQGEYAKFKKWDIDFKPHRKLLDEGFKREGKDALSVEDAFKSKDHPLRVSIVCAMWLTGFDVPSLSTLYLDKPLKAHTLMQAIARANRVSEGKANGLIVDYCGILKNLQTALATFTQQEGGSQSDVDPTKDKNELLDLLKKALDKAKDYLLEQGFEIQRLVDVEGYERINLVKGDALNAVNKDDTTRDHFESLAKQVIKLYRACLNAQVDGLEAYRLERDLIDLIYKRLGLERDKLKDKDISLYLRELQSVVDDHVDVAESTTNPEHAAFNISHIDFEHLRQTFAKSKHKQTRVQDLKYMAKQQLDQMVKQNPLRVDLQKRYQELVTAYNAQKDQQNIELIFNQLLQFVDNLSQEQQRAKREGLDEESLVIFDLLKKESLSKEERQQVKDVAVNLLKVLKAKPLKVANWVSKQETRAEVRGSIHNFLYDEETGLPLSYGAEEEAIIPFSSRVYEHVRQKYPCLPSPVYG